MKVKVWNKNVHPHSEMFRGDMINIPAGEFVEMEFMDAVQFKGQMSRRLSDADGAQDPRSFKMIQIEEVKQSKAETSKLEDDMALTCQSCNYKGSDQVDIAKHIIEKHADQLADKSRDEAGRKLQEALTKRR